MLRWTANGLCLRLGRLHIHLHRWLPAAWAWGLVCPGLPGREYTASFGWVTLHVPHSPQHNPGCGNPARRGGYPCDPDCLA